MITLESPGYYVLAPQAYECDGQLDGVYGDKLLDRLRARNEGFAASVACAGAPRILLEAFRPQVIEAECARPSRAWRISQCRPSAPPPNAQGWNPRLRCRPEAA